MRKIKYKNESSSDAVQFNSRKDNRSNLKLSQNWISIEKQKYLSPSSGISTPARLLFIPVYIFSPYFLANETGCFRTSLYICLPFSSLLWCLSVLFLCSPLSVLPSPFPLTTDGVKRSNLRKLSPLERNGPQ